MKKTLLASLLLSLPTYCLSWPAGFYGGIGAGADTEVFKLNAHVVRPGTFDVIQRDQLAAQGIFGTLFGGYAWYRNWFYLAGEANGNMSSASSYSSNSEAISKTKSATTDKINYGWGLSALPGIILPGMALIYGRIGYASGHFVISTSDASLYNAHQMLNGLRFGVGLEKYIANHFGVRFDYSHINYQNVSKRVFDPVGNVTKRTTIMPDSNLFEFSLTYRLV